MALGKGMFNVDIEKYSRIREYSKNSFSLGQNCFSANSLKALDMKDGSYPFDWVFSTPEMVRDCLGNRFQEYLNPAHFVRKPFRKAVGHRKYHLKMFNHRSPFGSDGFSYYKRCVNRFEHELGQIDKGLFLVNLIQEPEKRLDWKEGLVGGSSIATHKSEESYLDVGTALEENYGVEPYFLFVKSRSQCSDYRIELSESDLGLVIEIDVKGAQSGVKYQEESENFAFLTLLGRLLGVA